MRRENPSPRQSGTRSQRRTSVLRTALALFAAAAMNLPAAARAQAIGEPDVSGDQLIFIYDARQDRNAVEMPPDIGTVFGCGGIPSLSSLLQCLHRYPVEVRVNGAPKPLRCVAPGRGTSSSDGERPAARPLRDLLLNRAD